ncbi:MAG: substrate-binding domain-containing protein [Actinobacteria bacterium]|nr:substrate-binding domain-containing protein [Actinomycetota bacterium]
MNFKKVVVIFLVVAFALTIVTGCTGKSTVGETTVGENKGATGGTTQGLDKQLKMAMIVHDITSPFQAFFKAGGEDAAKAHNITFDFMGTTSIDIPKQVSMFENAIQGGYNGIALTIFDQKAFEKGINLAKEKGTAVISFNIDGDWGKRATLGYAGADEYQLGLELGRYFFKNVMKGKGKYILFPAIADLGVLVYRMNGIKKAQEEFPDIQYITTVEIGTDATKVYSNVENAYAAHPDVTGMVGTDFYGEGMCNFISKNNLKDKVFGACVDVTPGILKYLKEGSIQAIMGQNPYLQGYYAIDQLWIYLAKGIHPVEINTGTELVTQENMEPYLKYYNMQ